MDPLVEQFAERLVDHPLPLDPRLLCERTALDLQREVTLPGGVVAAMAAVLLAVVDEAQSRWLQFRFEAADHLGGDWASGG